MSGKYFLLGCFGREIDIPIMYDSLDEAREEMKEALISLMEDNCTCAFFGSMKDDCACVLSEYKKYSDYYWEPDSNHAWFSNRHGGHDWKIISAEEIELRTKQIKARS